MSETASTLDAIQRFDAVGAIAFGALGVMTPRLLQRVYGMSDPSGELRMMSRLWGSVLTSLGTMVLAAPPGAARKQALLALAGMNTVNAVHPLLTPDLSTRTRIGASLTSAVFAGASAYGATLEG